MVQPQAPIAIAPQPPAAPAGYTPVSLHPDDMVAGGAVPVGNQLVTHSRFAHFQYKTGEVGFGLLWTMVADDGTSNEQFFSAGDPKKWSPSLESAPGAGDAGRFPIPTAGDTALNNSSNCAFLLREMVNAGFPEANVREGDAMRFNGLYAAFESKKQPVRSGAGITQREGAVCTVPVTIHNTGWEASKRGTVAAAPTALGTAVAAMAPTASNGPAPAPAPAVAPAATPALLVTETSVAPIAVTPAPSAAPPGGPDVGALQTVCMDAINVKLGEMNPVPYAAVGAYIFQVHAANPNVTAFTSYLFSPEMLAVAQAAGIGTDGGQFSKAA